MNIRDRRDERAPSVIGRRVTLRPVTPSDYDYLYGLAVDPRSSFRWRLRGTTPDPRSFESLLWEQVLVQFLAIRTDTGQPVGLVVCLAPDMRSGVASLATLVAPELAGIGLGGDALALFVDYVFDLWNFRTLYAEMPEYNYAQFASGSGKWFDVVARVPERFWHAGRFWDNVILQLTRDRWDSISSRLMTAVRENDRNNSDA